MTNYRGVGFIACPFVTGRQICVRVMRRGVLAVASWVVNSRSRQIRVRIRAYLADVTDANKPMQRSS